MPANPEFAAAIALHQRGQNSQAADACSAILRRNPNDPDALQLLGVIAAAELRFQDAADYFGRMLRVQPNFAGGRLNFANALYECERFDEALEQLRSAVQLEPANPELRMRFGMSLLKFGRFEEGFAEYRHWANQVPKPRGATQPTWAGEDLKGKTILVWTVEGYGDAIMNVRYVPLLRDRGARVVLYCYPELRELFETVPGAAMAVTKPSQLPPCDSQCSTYQLPVIFGTTVETIPASVPYLSAPPSAAEAWRERLSPHPGRKIGIAWTGNPQNLNNRNRSIKPEQLTPLSAVPGVTWFSLQKGTPSPGWMVNFTDQLQTFADAAGLVQNLDCIVSVCTSTAHLAGAMARPTMLMLAAVADWRWFLGREDSPWYPTMRIFRQHRQGDWSIAIQRIASELAPKHD